MAGPLRHNASKVVVLTLLSIMAIIGTYKTVDAHEVRPAIADVMLSGDQIDISIRLTAETLLAGIDADGLQDTNDAPEAELYDSFRALPAEELATEVSNAWTSLQSGFLLRAGETEIALELGAVEVGQVNNNELPRDTVLQLSAPLPQDSSAVQFGWIAPNGPLIVRQAGGGDDAYAGYLEGGALSDPLPRTGAASESATAVFLRYIGVGFDHIIPKGLDHILFVLGLFFLSVRFAPLITQVTMFTLAHTITLALASLGYVTISPAIVEPLIAASIVYVAVENIFAKGITPWRPFVIFLFGLLHGLGFASVLGEFGLAPGRFVVGLIGFNVGVEVGQLTVIALAFLAVGYWFGQKDWYRSRIAIPASAVIAAIGGYWAIERTFF